MKARQEAGRRTWLTLMQRDIDRHVANYKAKRGITGSLFPSLDPNNEPALQTSDASKEDDMKEESEVPMLKEGGEEPTSPGSNEEYEEPPTPPVNVVQSQKGSEEFSTPVLQSSKELDEPPTPVLQSKKECEESDASSRFPFQGDPALHPSGSSSSSSMPATANVSPDQLAQEQDGEKNQKKKRGRRGGKNKEYYMAAHAFINACCRNNFQKAMWTKSDCSCVEPGLVCCFWSHAQ